MQVQPAVASLYDEVVRNQPVGKVNEGVDNRANRYIFNPFESIQLTSPYNRLFGMEKIHAGVIIPIRPFFMQEQDATVVARAHLLTESDTPGSSQRTIQRLPGYVVPAIMRDYSETYSVRTGLCEIESLIGFTDLAEVRELNQQIFGKMFYDLDAEGKIVRENGKPKTIYRTAKQRIEWLKAIKKGIGLQWESVLDALLDSYQMSYDWGIAHYHRLIKQLEAGSNNQPNGKLEISKLDERVCDYVEMDVPKRQSKLVQQDKQQPVNVHVVTAPAAQPAADAALAESGPCPNCWLTIPYRGGQPAPLCSHCGVPTSELVTEKVEPVTAAPAAEPFNPEKPMGDPVKASAVTETKPAKPQGNNQNRNR